MKLLLVMAALAGGSQSEGCKNFNDLCKDAAKTATQCAKLGGSNCEDLKTVEVATCAQAKILCADDTNPTNAAPPPKPDKH